MLAHPSVDRNPRGLTQPLMYVHGQSRHLLLTPQDLHTILMLMEPDVISLNWKVNAREPSSKIKRGVTREAVGIM